MSRKDTPADFVFMWQRWDSYRSIAARHIAIKPDNAPLITCLVWNIETCDNAATQRFEAFQYPDKERARYRTLSAQYKRLLASVVKDVELSAEDEVVMQRVSGKCQDFYQRIGGRL